MSKKVKLDIIGAPINEFKLQFLVSLWTETDLSKIGIFGITYSDNSTLIDESDILYEIRAILDSLVEKFRKHEKSHHKGYHLTRRRSHCEGASVSGRITLVHL
jgi:hypothetical protein